jgi:rubredoxin
MLTIRGNPMGKGAAQEMTDEFVRWHCPKCQRRNALPVASDADSPPLRCAHCGFLFDPLDEEPTEAAALPRPRAPGRKTPT